jgi:hypothetical protein
MMLHIDGSHHQWFQDERWHDLIVILDDATSEIYYAQLAQEETTATVMTGLRAVMERKGVFCSLYSDRGAHFWYTPKTGGKVDRQRPTQVGRAMQELGVQMIAAYSPQARGRSERCFSTWQGRLPQELRLREIRTLEAANAFLSEQYVTEFNRKFQVTAPQRGTAFLPCPRKNLDLIFSQRFERTVDRDNTVSFHNLILQIEPTLWRGTMAGCKMIVNQHLDATITLTIGTRRVGHYSEQGELLTPITKEQAEAVEKTRAGKVRKTTFPPRLQIPQTTRDSHFPTATAATKLIHEPAYSTRRVGVDGPPALRFEGRTVQGKNQGDAKARYLRLDSGARELEGRNIRAGDSTAGSCKREEHLEKRVG